MIRARAELENLSREFDGDIEPRFLVPSAVEKKRHDQLMRCIKRRRGRPKVGGGSKRVQITMEATLLSAADRFARARGISRSELIAGCLLPLLRKSA